MLVRNGFWIFVTHSIPSQQQNAECKFVWSLISTDLAEWYDRILEKSNNCVWIGEVAGRNTLCVCFTLDDRWNWQVRTLTIRRNWQEKAASSQLVDEARCLFHTLLSLCNWQPQCHAGKSITFQIPIQEKKTCRKYKYLRLTFVNFIFIRNKKNSVVCVMCRRLMYTHGRKEAVRRSKSSMLYLSGHLYTHLQWVVPHLSQRLLLCQPIHSPSWKAVYTFSIRYTCHCGRYYYSSYHFWFMSTSWGNCFCGSNLPACESWLTTQ